MVYQKSQVVISNFNSQRIEINILFHPWKKVSNYFFVALSCYHTCFISPFADRTNVIANRQPNRKAPRVPLRVQRVYKPIQVRLAAACPVAAECLQRPVQRVVHITGQCGSHSHCLRARTRATLSGWKRKVLQGKPPSHFSFGRLYPQSIIHKKLECFFLIYKIKIISVMSVLMV